MPAVPELNAPSVGPAQAPNAYQQISGISPDAFGAGIAQSLQQAGNDASRQAINYQDIQNEAEAQELSVQASTKFGLAHTDFLQKQGRDAIAAGPGYVSGLQSTREDILSQASNPAVRRMLDSKVSNEVGRYIVSGSEHVGEQTKQYAISTSNAVIANNQSMAANEPDHDAFQSRLNSINAEFDKQAKLNGEAPEVTDGKKRKAITDAWDNRLNVIGESDPFKARDLFNHVKSQLDGTQAVDIEKKIDNQIVQVGSKQIANRVTSDGPTQDQAGKENYALNQLTPVAGRFGAAALIGGFHQESRLDPTQVARGDGSDGSDSIGIGQWNQNRAKALQDFAAKQGTDWHDYKTQIQFVNQELTTDPHFKQVAELLRGATSVEDATRIANQYYEVSADSPQGNDRQRAGYQNRLSNATRLAGVTPTPIGFADDKPGQLDRAVAQAQTEAQSQAQKLFPGNPTLQAQLEETTLAHVRQNYNLVMAERRDRYNGDVQTVQDGIASGRYKTIDDLAADPQVGQSFKDLPVNRQIAMKNLMARANDPPDDEVSRSRFNELKGMAATDPKEFLGVDLEKEQIPKSMFSSLVNLRSRVVKNAQADPDVGAAMRSLTNQNFFQGTSVLEDKTEKLKFSGALYSALQNFKSVNKRDPNPDETRQLGTDLIRETKPGGIISSPELAYQNISAPVTAQERPAFNQLFRDKFKLGRDPTDQEIYQMKAQINANRARKAELGKDANGG